MDLTLDSQQDAFVSATVDWCRTNLPLEQARSRPAGLWPQLEAMGWTGMTAPGMDLDHATEAVVFSELGRFVAPIALLSTAVAARWAGTTGKVALALADHGGTLRVLDGEGAVLALGVTDGAAALYRLPDNLTYVAGLDLSAPLARLDSAPEAAPIADPRAALHLQLLAAAYAVGCAEAARDMAADYAKIREQFERPIGWFQALKHVCSDTAVRAAVARSQLCYAACALDEDDDTGNGGAAAFHIAAAKRLANDAAIDNSRANIQVHGGIGMTDEAYPHFCLKRAHLLALVTPASREVILGTAA